MRKLSYILLCMLLAGSTVVSAQGPAGRTTTTIVADVLAQMPARDGARFDALMEELASTGTEGVLQLTSMLVPDGEGSNARVEYALNGLSHWVSAEGREALRLTASDAYIEALSRVSDREIGTFIINQLELIGKNEAVETLTALLDDSALHGPAREALAAISGNALPEPVVSFDELAPASADVRAFYDKVAAKPSQATKLLTKALKDDSRDYRYAALRVASRYADPDMYRTLVKSMAKADPAVKVDILNWLSEECNLPGRRAVITPIAGDAAIGQLTAGNAELTRAAAGLLVKTAGDKAITAMASLLKADDPAIVDIAAKALASTKGDISTAVAGTVSTAANIGKIAALQLLAGRGATDYSDAVFAETNSDSPEVREAAYVALKDVVSTEDADKLWPMLENATAEEVPFVQRAVSSAIHTLPAGEQYSTVFARMNTIPADKQYLYYPVLAYTGDNSALELIVDRFENEKGAAKDAAFDALDNWQVMNVADRLLAICKNPVEAPYFDRAITRYTNLISASALPDEERRARLVEALDIAKTDAQKSALLRGIGETNSYPGMVKAGEYLDNPATAQAAAGAVMKIALGNPQFAGEDVRTLLEKVISVLDNPDAGYEQQAIRKHLGEMPDMKPFELSDEEKAEGFTVLFDGTNLDAWTGNKTDYLVENGTISLYPSRSFGGNLYTAKEYGNFVYRFEFMLTPGANNGVGIRTPKDVDAAYHGMEIQILDHDDPAYRDITTHQVHGSVYGVIGAKRAVLRPAGEWNCEEIVADGDHIKVTLNGEVILDGNIREASKGGTFDGHAHPGLFNKKGYIGFLGHGSQLKFRNIRIKELK